jgi:hypothetical protein
MRSWTPLIALAVLVAPALVQAGPAPISPYPAIPENGRQAGPDGIAGTDVPAPGDPVDLGVALAAGADYLRRMQADITEDTAGNGSGAGESPNDPDDGSWDWVVTSPPAPVHHTTSPSPVNIGGATGQGVLEAYIKTLNPTLLTVLGDLATGILADPDKRSASDLVFLMRYDDLPPVVGDVYRDEAKARYDQRIADAGSATALAESIRDTRMGQGYENGIIAWDVGHFVRAASMLGDIYGGGYATDAANMAEVLYQDSFADNPGYFDVVDDAGFDPTYTNTNFYWYTLGLSGLLESFSVTGTHTSEIPDLIQRILDSQYGTGAVSGSYGANPGDEDWQATAYCALALARHDLPTFQLDISHMAYWIGATQDGVETMGGWRYSSDAHYPEIAGENTAALAYGIAPSDVIVDDDFAGQTDVDTYNGIHGTTYVWGYDAFADIQSAADAVVGSTITVLPGTYAGGIVLSAGVNLHGAQVGVDARGRVVGVPDPATESIITSGAGLLLELTSGSSGAVIDGFVFLDAARAIESTSGPLDDVVIRNNHFEGQSTAVMFLNDAGEDMTLHQNVFDGAAGTSTMVHFDQDAFHGLHVTSNHFLDRADAAAMFVDGNHNVSDSALRTPLIADNLFSGNAVGANLGRFAFENGDITDNTLDGNLSVGIQGGMQSSTLSGNLFSGNGSYGLALTGFGGGSDPTRGAQDLVITGNEFLANGTGLLYSSGQFPGTVATNTVTGNDFVGNTTGASYAGSESIDLSCNWWGDAGGPDAVTNPNPPGDPISGSSLVYWPWLDGSISGTPSCVSYGSNTVAAVSDGDCISIDNPCETVDVVFDRVDTADARAISVTFELDGLELCGSAPASIVQGTWLDGFGSAYQVVDHGGGVYTVDQAILGLPCGVTTGGLLFTVDLTTSGSDGTGTVTVTSVTVRDCDNQPLAGLPGAATSFTIDTTAPAAATNVTALQTKTGNDTDGTTTIDLAWDPVVTPDANTVDVYRMPYGDYPAYDTGSVPSVPTDLADAIADGWTLAGSVPAASTTFTDDPAVRDYFYYVAFVIDDCGNASPTSAMAVNPLLGTSGTLSYHLGDVSDGVTAGVGDNDVGTPDLSLLGTNYGITLVPGDPLSYLDFGPTLDMSVNARPVPDDAVGFEELNLLAINYGQVSREAGSPAVARVLPLAAARPTVRLEHHPAEGDGVTRLDLVLEGNRDQVKAASLRLRITGAEEVIASRGELLDASGLTFFTTLDEEDGLRVDLAAIGHDRVLEGDGVLASLVLRGPDAIGVFLDAPDLRDRHNRFLGVTPAWFEALAAQAAAVVPGSGGVDEESAREEAVVAARPDRIRLIGARPNPFTAGTTIRFELPEAASVRLQVFDVHGRRVVTLADTGRGAGVHEVHWDGRDAGDQTVASGVYFLRMQVGAHVTTTKLFRP